MAIEIKDHKFRGGPDSRSDPLMQRIPSEKHPGYFEAPDTDINPRDEMEDSGENKD